MTSMFYEKIPEDIKQLIAGKAEHVCLVKDGKFNKDDIVSNDSTWFDGVVSDIAKQAMDDFNQELDKKLEYLVVNCGKEILDHIRIVMEPTMVSVSYSSPYDLDNYTYALTTQARLEYFVDAEVVE